MDRFLRQATPLLLICLALMVWFESYLPLGGLRDLFGETGLLRFITGVLCLYTLLLVLERQRMEQSFKQVMQTFLQFNKGRQENAAASDSLDQTGKEQAVEILVAALESPDQKVRQTSLSHLQRLTGQDLGPDPAAWKAWMAASAAGNPDA